MGKNPPTKLKDAVFLHLANKYKSAKIKYIETGRKKFSIRYSENKKSKATALYLASSGFSRPDAAVRRERNHCEQPIASLIGRRLASWTNKLTLNE